LITPFALLDCLVKNLLSCYRGVKNKTGSFVSRLWLTTALNMRFIMMIIGLFGFVGIQAYADPLLLEYRLNDFSVDAYRLAVERLIAAYEHRSGFKLVPGSKKKIGLKLDTLMGPGLSTPHALTEAVIDCLRQRGFDTQNIIIFDLNRAQLRAAGYLPALSEGGPSVFKNCVVWAIEDDQVHHPKWFYENSLPSPIPLRLEGKTWEQMMEAIHESKRSYLPIKIFLDVDGWINLPVIKEHPSIGIMGALGNASLQNVTNYRRFLKSPAVGPIAIAEICAIPELRQPWVFTLISLEHYQYLGGLKFASQYTASEPLLWLSDDPVWIDYLALKRINFHRQQAGFELYLDKSPLFEAAQSVQLGTIQKGKKMILK